MPRPVLPRPRSRAAFDRRFLVTLLAAIWTGLALMAFGIFLFGPIGEAAGWQAALIEALPALGVLLAGFVVLAVLIGKWPRPIQRVTPRRAAPRIRPAVETGKERLELATRSANIGLWDWHAGKAMTWVNPDWWAHLGYPPGAVSARITAEQEPVHPDDFAMVTEQWQAFIAGVAEQFNCEYRQRDGAQNWRWIQSIGRVTERRADGTPERVSGVFIDIDERKRAEEQRVRDQEQLWALANVDNLTRLPNRGLFFSRLEEAIAGGGNIAVGIVDLDRFKEVNDSFGHLIGDELLTRIADRLRSSVRAGDFVARLSGDEFAFFLTDIGDDNTAIDWQIEAILSAICEPVELSNHAKRGGGSIGFAVCPQDGTSSPDLLRRADIALYAAKSTGRQTAMRFTAEMEARLNQGRQTRDAFERAIASGEIEVYYQPLLSVDRSTIRGFEALARWRHPEQGLIGPEAFVEILREAEPARQLGVRVRALVFGQIAAWRAAGVRFGRVAINVMAADFQQGGVTEELLALLGAGTLTPGELCLEVTEGVLLDGAANSRIRKDLFALRRAGVEIAFDDFGTGFASLAHLRDYPIDRLKIDCSFVMNLPASRRDFQIIRTIGTLARDLNLQVTAEGVETEEQAEMVRSIGATELQGYLFGKPMEATQVAGFIAGFKPAPAAPAQRVLA